jgi:hypothetical protein
MFICKLLATMEKKNLVEGMDLNGDHDLSFYDGSVYSKHHHTPFPLNRGSHAKEIIGRVHTNLCGPMITSH